MTIQVALSHETTYTYDHPVDFGPHIIRLRPAPHCRTPISSYSLRVTPENHFLNWQQDPHGNHLARLVFPEKTDQLHVNVDLVAQLTVINPFDFFLEPSVEHFPFAYDPDVARDLLPFRQHEPAGTKLAELLNSIDQSRRSTIQLLVDINQQLSEQMDYVVREEPGIQTPEESLSLGRGSCRDTGWLLVHVLRHLGLAARFVSGYLIQLKPDEKPANGTPAPEKDATDLHAWAEVYLPGAGWIGMDPTSGLLAGEGHLPLACAPEPITAAPISGSVENCRCQFRVKMAVTRIQEDMRVTKPYSDERWSQITSTARYVDKRLAAGGVQLHNASRPTFTTVDECIDESNLAPPTADAPGCEQDLDLAYALCQRLSDRFANGAVVQRVDSVSPGRPVRAPGRLACLWRKDGNPIWRDSPRMQQRNPRVAYDDQHVERFAHQLAKNLDVDLSLLEPCRSDITLTGQSETSTAIAITLPWRPSGAMEEMSRTDGPCDHLTDLRVAAVAGKLRVSIPRVDCIDDYLDLVTKIETTSEALDWPVALEGDLPPPDNRLHQIIVTPHTGSIQVEFHGASSWEELESIERAAYEIAEQAGLRSEVFDVNGGHLSTGRGNPIVIGGPTPQCSPLLERPDLLRSLIAYWHNHPALSHLFAGRRTTLASTRQRIDQAGCDATYELEIALTQLDAAGDDHPPWLFDRVLHNVLKVGATVGNTAEFCIEELYPTNHSHNRLGLLAIRAFEMPPHPEMRLTEQLLVRALISRFWDHPYRERLVRWGSAIRDRFMLPCFIWQDLLDVVEETRHLGIPLDASWFAPHFEFQFPVLGSFTVQGMHIELRQALESPFILNDSTSDGNSVLVDESVERLQIKVMGLNDVRHTITCNARKIPFHRSGTSGEFVAAVRYSARQSTDGLHPMLPVDFPLRFDILDKWQQRSVGGCTLHAGHPGGMNSEKLPVNANEAESRRAARFSVVERLGGELSIPLNEDNPTFPMTLDLRRGRRTQAG